MQARSWFPMGPKRRSSDSGEQIIKQGCLIKSPPFYIFNKKASWKRRLLKLCRIGAGSFVLRYYAYDGVSEDWKGDIHISDIKSVELGSTMMEKIPTITRLFNNSPNNILCIKTDKRDYYLVDDGTESIAEWQKSITDAWMKVHNKMIEEVCRPKSYPEDYPHTAAVLAEELNRQRSHTDPESRKGDLLPAEDYRESMYEICKEKQTISERQDSDTSAPYNQIPLYESHPRQGATGHTAAAILKASEESRRFSDDLTDPAYDSELDYIYDTPRPVPVKVTENAVTEQEETSDLDTEEDELYEKMSSIAVDEVTNLPSEPLQTEPAPNTRHFKTQRSQLKKAQILRMMYEPRSESDMVSVKLTVETEHLQKYLGVQEIGERLCVSKWKGPLHIGCLFHHGDHIESINGFRPGTKDLFLQMLSSSIASEVTLVLTRNKKAAVFHLEGCSCGDS
ncbi:pleckstrin homology domain-containing family S member 1 isoform X2 [Eleutherodactylus coqui]